MSEIDEGVEAHAVDQHRQHGAAIKPGLKILIGVEAGQVARREPPHHAIDVLPERRLDRRIAVGHDDEAIIFKNRGPTASAPGQRACIPLRLMLEPYAKCNVMWPLIRRGARTSRAETTSGTHVCKLAIRRHGGNARLLFVAHRLLCGRTLTRSTGSKSSGPDLPDHHRGGMLSTPPSSGGRVQGVFDGSGIGSSRRGRPAVREQ